MGITTSVGRAAALVLATLTALLIGTTAALAQDYPPGPDEMLTCNPERPEPGETVVCESGGWMPGSEVRVNVAGVMRTTRTADSDTFIDFSFEAPDREAVNIILRGTDVHGNEVVVREQLDIQREGGRETAPGLADTGATMTPLIAVAIGLLALGGGAVYAARRKGRQDTSA